MSNAARWAATTGIVFALTAPPAANALTLNAANSGWWNGAGSHSAGNTNYIVGHTQSPSPVDYHNFFVFDLSPVAPSDAVWSAVLVIDLSTGGGYGSSDPSETYRLYDVSTPISMLTADGSNVAVYNDLGSGSTYGSRVLMSTEEGTAIRIALNASAIAALNANLGGPIALGGAVTTLSAAAVDEFLFGYYVQHDRQLVLGLESECGNGLLDLGEGCDDGNSKNGDCCSSTCQYDDAGAPCDDGYLCTFDRCDGVGTCVSGPQPSCLSAAKASVEIEAMDAGTRDQVKWKLSLGDAFDQSALGDPLTSTSYQLCVYDTHDNGAPMLDAAMTIAPSAIWRDKAPRGLSYRDKTGAQDGIVKVRLKTGIAGETVVQVLAKGPNLPAPTPITSTDFFYQEPSVIVQLVDSAASCWSAEYTSATRNDGDQFKAALP